MNCFHPHRDFFSFVAAAVQTYSLCVAFVMMQSIDAAAKACAEMVIDSPGQLRPQ